MTNQLKLCLQDIEDKIKEEKQYEQQHGRPEWADVMHILPEDFEVLKKEDPTFAHNGPDPDIVDYFRAAHAENAKRAVS